VGKIHPSLQKSASAPKEKKETPPGLAANEHVATPALI